MSWLGLVGTVSCCALVLIFGLMLFPSLPQATYAAPEPGAGGVTPSTGTSVGISLPASIDFESVTPTPDGATTTATADLTVTTTNSASYSLYLYSSDGDNSLRPKISANTSSIIATAGGVGLTLSSLKPNTWGYSLGTSAPDDNTTYSAVPTDSTTPIQTKDTSDTNSADDTYTLSLGAKVDNTIASGAYSNALTVAVVAEPGGIPIIYNANGGYFNNDPSQTTQMVNYSFEGNSDTKIAKTPNISDAGIQSGGYGSNVSETQTVTIPGASSLRVVVSYQTATSGLYPSEWLAIYDGSVTPSEYNYNDSITGKLSSTIKVNNRVFIIPGDTAQFYFQGDSTSSAYYGYYAVVNDAGLDVSPNVEILSPTRPGYSFDGWYKDTAGTKGEDFVLNTALKSGTVYAKWLPYVGYIQDFNNSQCQALASNTEVVATDIRDSNTYTLRYINGACWMTQNLQLSGGRILAPSDSNVTRNWSFPNTSLDLGSSYTDARSRISSDISYGGYYNYCAASAGTICDDTTTEEAVQDICPRGWRLPTHSEQSGITAYPDIFSHIFSGEYGSTGIYEGDWWSSTALFIMTGIGPTRHALGYLHGYLDSSYQYFATDKSSGLSIRCVRSN